ncbi:MAG: flagellar FlbD family protein [Oscillospiraceae bacterium]|jgi:flagellar protein FlbD|nr:flagellar FlbD family protein [Oscillospiraceae bacterium]MCI2034473.1 flagellar FlbD family protein [Oscillospiraceae bacterium]
MIDLTQLDGTPFSLNTNLIEIIENIPETKISLTSGKYYLVRETREEIKRKVLAYQRRVFKNIITVKGPSKGPTREKE